MHRHYCCYYYTLCMYILVSNLVNQCNCIIWHTKERETETGRGRETERETERERQGETERETETEMDRKYSCQLCTCNPIALDIP